MRHRQDVLDRRRSLRLTALACALALVAALWPPVTSVAVASTAPQVTGLLVDGLALPLGIATDTPRLSWQLEADRRGVEQSAYQVQVASSEDGLAQPDLWDSGRVTSDQQMDVAYDGDDLRSRTRYHWRVRVWDEDGSTSGWSEPSWFETGMDADDWSAAWIGADDGDGIGDEWTDYTVSFTASDIDGALGVYFRGRHDDHAYMWQLSEAEGALRPHVKEGGYRVLPSAPFPAGFDPAAEHDYEIEVAGDTITTRIDGEVLDVRTDGTHLAPGIVGFRTSGPERGLVHEVTVTSADGSVLVDTDFPANDTTFRAGQVTDDGLLVSGNAEAWLSRPDPVPALRRSFETDGRQVVAARVYAAARGVYELELNGEPVGDHELAPGWTDYRARIQHQTFDVTDQVRAGENVLGAEVADGWYAGNVAMFGPGHYGDTTSLIAELHLTYDDGTVEVIATDGDWVTTDGPRTAADILDGETYDARRAAELDGWSLPGYDATSWEPVVVRDEPTSTLQPQIDQPVRVTEELDATYLSSPSPGTHIYDLGQNMVGRVRITVQGETGDQIRLRHAEVLNPEGTMYVANLRRDGMAVDRYILGSDGPETYEPAFTFHGFRYVEVSGVDDPPPAEDVVGVVLGTDGPLVSSLETSSEMVDQLQRNIVWGMRGNFLSIPTDTPARDERMGWTGDINVFARTAVYNMDSQAFLSKWLLDLRDTQRADGALPGVAPVVPGAFDGGYGRAGWADAGVNVPYVLWDTYGDLTVIHDNYEMMTRFVDYLEATSNGGIRNVGGYDDWLNLDDPTPTPVIDTAFVAKSARQLSEMATVIGEDADAARYRQLYEDVRAAFIDEFIAADGTVRGDSQTAYILTITNDLVPDDRRDDLIDRFVATIERRDWHLSTGFLGVDGLLSALTEVGRTDVAYRLLQNTSYPSWGYAIERGATTIWERWNSIMPDGSFGPVEMNSFNHYAYGAVGEWMYRTMAGVSALEPGYRSILVAPELGEGIDHVDLTHETRYGTVRSAWERDGDDLHLEVEIPAGSTATVRVPASSRWAVTEGGVPAEDADHVRLVEVEDDHVVYEVGSGAYVFAVDPVLGAIGHARAETAVARDLVDAAAADGDLQRGSANHLTAQLRKLEREVDAAWSTHLAGGDAVADVHRALSTVTNLARWLETAIGTGRVGGELGGALDTSLTAIDGWLSDASSALVGAVPRLDLPADGVVAGDRFRASVVLENTGDHTLSSVETTLTSAAGWEVSPVGSSPASVEPGGTAVHEYDVTVPVDQRAGTARLQGTVAYRHRGGTATHTVAGDVTVAPAVAITDVTVAPAEAQPGTTTEVAAELHNRSGHQASETVTLEVPDGWRAPDPVDVTLAPGETTTITLPLEVPLEVTGGETTVTAATGPAAAERRSATLEVVFVNPPEVVIDHVDLGNAASEAAHGLTASPASGTSIEAGMTRRYTDTTVPGGWFEFDLEVPVGEPFILRAIETYDGPQLKDYEVLIDGEVVHTRRHRRTASGHGTVTYQFIVDAPEATADGVVRVRFADTDEGYDPSIADVWSSPVGAGVGGG